jgi:hypothetical protein
MTGENLAGGMAYQLPMWRSWPALTNRKFTATQYASAEPA